MPHFFMSSFSSSSRPGTTLTNIRSPWDGGSECTAPSSSPTRKNVHSPGPACTYPWSRNSSAKRRRTDSAAVAHPTHRTGAQRCFLLSSRTDCFIRLWMERVRAGEVKKSVLGPSRVVASFHFVSRSLVMGSSSPLL